MCFEISNSKSWNVLKVVNFPPPKIGEKMIKMENCIIFLKPSPSGYLTYEALNVAPMEKWWKSTEILPGSNVYGSYITRKKWNLNEV